LNKKINENFGMDHKKVKQLYSSFRFPTSFQEISQQRFGAEYSSRSVLLRFWSATDVELGADPQHLLVQSGPFSSKVLEIH